MNPEYLEIDDTIEDSPVGPGTITGITQRGYPQVNYVAVAWLKRTDAIIFNPHNHQLPIKEQHHEYSNSA
jgi:hypothetical protein